MPKVVDHDSRRSELVEAAWRVIARRGLTGATMRQIAEQAGYAHGALKPYFPAKTDLLDATYAHVFGRTQARIDEALAGVRGLEALRRLCLEVLPVDEDLLVEARLVISFWDQAARHEAEARVAAATLEAWRARLDAALGEADDDDALRPDLDRRALVDLILTWLFGAQVTAVVDADRHDRAALEAQLALLTAAIRRM